jgi:hypothetical protein
MLLKNSYWEEKIGRKSKKSFKKKTKRSFATLDRTALSTKACHKRVA